MNVADQDDQDARIAVILGEDEDTTFEACVWKFFECLNRSPNEELQAELDRIQQRIERLLSKDMFED